MHLKSIILEGFKSYGKRTEVRGFDREFTAITGLNGTGKSNILDGICFVLGISNMSQVRAGSIKDLIYKGGQTNIKHANVTLIFDNTNQNQCPIGYEKCSEISITRRIEETKTKYFINGRTVQAKKVTDFFCGIQLNVNNPNFLIMQGHITKVLNMKPQEVLSMIEEAAGTSLYESKRDATTKLMEKKENKVRETNTLLKEEVEPKLEKLRAERDRFVEFQRICRDIEYLTRIHISYRFLKLEEAVQKFQKTIDKLNERIAICNDTIAANNEETVRIEESSKQIQSEIDSESGGELKKIEEELHVVLQSEAKANGSIKAAQSNIDQEEKKIRAIDKNIADDEKALKQKDAQMSKVEGLFQSLKDADTNDALAYEQAQRTYEAVMQGLSTNEDGKATSLQDQLIAAKQQASEAQTTLKTSDMELRHCRNVLKQKESENQNNDAAYIKDKRAHDALEEQIKNIQRQLDSMDYVDGAFEQLQERKNTVMRELRQKKQQLDRSNAFRYDLQYRDPEPNFNRKKFHGMVGKLLDVKDNRNYLALTMTAGGGLYSYVADDDVTSKKILQKGQLQKRATIIPINKITSHAIPQNTVDFAKRLVGNDNVHSALSCINYDRYFDPVMKFVFGHTLVCSDLNVAKQVTFHANIRCRTVTLEGDIVDPEGTLSGGSAPKGANVLEELAQIKQLEREMNELQLEMQEIDRKLTKIDGVARNYNKCKEALELRQYELDACKQRLAQTTFQQHQDEIKSLKERITSLESDLVNARDSQKKADAKIKDIEAKLADTKGHRDREMKAATAAMQAAKKKSEQSRINWENRQHEFETLKLEIDGLRKSIETAKQSRDDLEKKLVETKEKLADMRQSVAEKTQIVNELKEKIKKQKDVINSQNKEIRNLHIKREKLQKQNQEMTLEIKKKENEVTKTVNESKDSRSKMQNLIKKYDWIPEEKEFFGVKNTRYDYAKEEPIAASQKLNQMQQQKEKMERNINTRAMIMLEREEDSYDQTIRRKKIVEEDKQKIEQIIVKMDEQKRLKMEKAWREVDKNFSSIFCTLLQGAQARLNPVTKGNALLGLEIKVGFNGLWKESLSELSGGQRSLVALSLVLAMLKFSPAPLYILDEVDAALDMSHTQNIGNMLKQHFTNSQFVIVSLKDGMFNNANVLFRTRFDEGVSAVTRTENPRLARKR